MKSDTRYSHIVNNRAMSGKTMDNGENKDLASFCGLRSPVSTVLPAVYAH